ncbi:serine hydrolase domain-containing protein [uncultured Aquimarina sp.]|uniref:serine hydrolase domain-containing protein n=1 Tax=uncultured Aquimarina sp. TaxID=575652 RepID=UPI00261CA58D|nr:serine hydrolase domain-containing protein [uncultured Aquimarina sp.]
MKRIFSALLLLFTPIVLINCKSHTSIDSYMKELAKEGDFNGNVLVVKNGETIYENSFGFSDGSKTTKLTNRFRFDLGSVYKEFPAVSILQLQEKGLLHTDDRIDIYLKDLPNWSSKITIKNLLQYTSGLPKVAWDKYFEKDEKITDQKIKNDLLNLKELEFEPGSDYLYTNYSPILLGQIVANITKQAFPEYVKENLFIPFGLNSAKIQQEVPYLNSDLMAIPFDENFKEDTYKASISGVIFSLTARDLQNWLTNLHAFKIISKVSLQFLSEEADFWGNIQAPLGGVTWKNGIVKEHYHHGETGNYECIVKRFNNGKDVLTIIVQANQKHQNMFDISDEIKSILKFN